MFPVWVAAVSARVGARVGRHAADPGDAAGCAGWAPPSSERLATGTDAAPCREEADVAPTEGGSSEPA